VDISLVGLQLVGVSVVHLAAIRLQLSCGRCKTASDVNMSFPKDGTTLAPAGTGVECPQCHLRLIVKVHPRMAHQNSSLIAIAQPLSCVVRDLLPSDYILTCTNCSASSRMKEVFSGVTRTSVCRHCHSKMAISFSSVAIGMQPDTSATGADLAALLKQLDIDGGKKKKGDEFVIRVGTPLPDNGTCKHYKKSYRWLRFPCCGKAYPCDVCHNEAADHECEWATRMICGFCSREQPYSQKPCVCGASMTRKTTTHWEGGKGCRDASKMSSKDSHKWRLLSRQKQAMEAAAAKKKK